MGIISNYNNSSNISSNIDKDIIQHISDIVKYDCIKLIIDGYNQYLADEEVIFSIDEPTITAGLYGHIENQINCTDIQCTIVPELPEFTKSIRKGRTKPKKAKKYDLCFIHFQIKPNSFFGVEAKLLVEENYKNKNANFLISEYVEDKGMGKYINKIYEKEGLMLGYILKGNPLKIVEKINFKINDVYSINDSLKHPYKFENFEPYLFISSHAQKKELIHLFLDFEKFSNYS
ncbi:MAG: hypothetical protein NVV82_11675 [Sporocytophaga sp.]|nr:hypothetical protein [Sporocytophaga sp.]